MNQNRIIFFRKMVIASVISLMLACQFAMASYAEATRYNDSFSRSAIISDIDTGRIIYEKNADNVQSMASISKVMTLLIAFDAIDSKKASEDDVVTIVQSDVNRYGTHMELVAGDKVTLRELMEGMMLISANDAALAIARHIGGSYENFAKLMNKKAVELGMTNTKFYNPNGLPEQINYDGSIMSVENKTTARDVLKLSFWIYKKYPNKLIKITNKSYFTGVAKKINKENTNPLIPLISNVDGLKTGFTDSAGYCLAYSMTTDKGNGNDSKNRLVGVSLGAPSKDARKSTTFNALTYIAKHYKTKILYSENSKISNTNIAGLSIFDIDVSSRNEIKVMKKDTEKIKQSIRYNTVKLMDNNDSPIGKIVIKDKYDNIISENNIYTEKPLEKLPYFDKLKISFSAIYSTLFGIDSNGEYPVFKLF